MRHERPARENASGERRATLPFRENRICSLVYEDDRLLVVDKKPGYLTVPTEKHELNTVVAALCRYVSKKRGRRTLVHIVHRLDRETSGILVFAKDEDTADALIGQFRERKPPREYVAIVAGVIDVDSGTMESRLVTDRFLNQRSTRRDDEGKDAVTHFEVRQRLRDTTVVTVRLETGRRNQIRVHFAERGHPVIGDRRYKTQRADHPRWGHKRLALHARMLGFRHPVTGKDMMFESPVPREFRAFVDGDARGRRS